MMWIGERRGVYLGNQRSENEDKGPLASIGLC